VISYLCGKYPGVELLHQHGDCSFRLLEGPPCSFSILVALVSIPSSVYRALFSASSSTLVTFHFGSNSCLTDVRWHLIVVLVCISLMINDVKQFFSYLLALCMFCLGKCLLRSLIYFSVAVFVFSVLQCLISLYILGINIPTDVWAVIVHGVSFPVLDLILWYDLMCLALLLLPALLGSNWNHFQDLCHKLYPYDVFFKSDSFWLHM
jgi:hypothetical protein